MPRWELHDGQGQVGPHDEGQVLAMIRAGLPPATMVRAEGTEAWKGLRSHAPFAMALEARDGGAGAYAAPPPAAPPVRTWPVSKSDFIGAGCLVQGLGFIAPGFGFLFGGPVGGALGLILFLVLLLVGSRMSRYWTCGACANRLPDKSARLCPVCRATLG